MVKIQLSFYEESTPQGHIKEFSRTNKNDQGRIINVIGQSINESPYRVLETVRNVDGKIFQNKYELRHSDVEKLFKEPEKNEIKPVPKKRKVLRKKPTKKKKTVIKKRLTKTKKIKKKVVKKPTKTKKKIVKKEDKGILSKIFGI